MTPADQDLAEARAYLAARFNAVIAPLSGRDDVLLHMHWGGTPDGTEPPGRDTGQLTSVPGWFDPATAEVTLNGTVLLGPDVHPDDVDPLTRAGRLDHPVPFGVAAHEAGHARATRWHHDVPDRTPAAVLKAATLLEEPRIERRQVTSRPGDRVFLRAAATSLIRISPLGSDAPLTARRWQAATAITLLCGRAAAGVLDDSDVTDVRAAAAAVLGTGPARELEDLVREATKLPDDDGTGLLALARRWAELAGPPPDDDAAGAPAGACAAGLPGLGAGSSHGRASEAGGDAVADVIRTATARITAAAVGAAAAEAAEAAAEAGPDPAVLAARTAEAAARADAARTADSVFSSHGYTPHSYGSPVTGERDPSRTERAAAVQLAAALRRARYRARAVTRVASAVPPGRLNGRDAMAGHAQRQMGLPVTARPFTAKVRRHVEQPPLAVGLAIDVSGSMRWATHPVASATWIIASAAARVGGKVASVAFGTTVTALAVPGAPPARVPVLAARDGSESFCSGVRALDGVLGLSTGRGARLLVIVSDGELVAPGEKASGQQLITRLVQAGTAVLWLDPDGKAVVMAGAARVPLPAPAEAAAVIGAAAAAALAAA